MSGFSVINYNLKISDDRTITVNVKSYKIEKVIIYRRISQQWKDCISKQMTVDLNTSARR